MDSKTGLPAGWKWVRLGEVCEIFSGTSAPQDEKYFENGRYPFVRVSDLGAIGRTTNLIEVKDYINELCLKELNMVKASKGTIFFPKSGAAITTNNRAILGIDAFIVSHLAAVKPKENIAETHFVYYWLYLTDMVQYMDNMGYPSLKLSTISSIQIPLPPLSEQKRIAAKLQEMMKEIDQARTACKKQLEAAKSLPSSYLHEVFESPEVQKWERKKLGEVCEIIKGKKPNLYDKKVSNQALSYLTAEFIRYDIKPSWCLESNGDVVSVNKDEIIIIADGSNSGEVFIGYEGALASTMGKLRIAEEQVLTDHLYSFIKMNFKELNVPKRGSAIPHLEKDIFYNLIIPFPPLPEQQRIASYLKEKIDQAEKLRASIEKELETINALPQSILSKAFKGEL
jgi:type I restriction enzyme S subunit